MRPYLSDWFGNPSSDHAYAAQPKAAIARASTQVATLIAAEAEEIVFAGSGPCDGAVPDRLAGGAGRR